MTQRIYVIYDLKAEMTLGGLFLHRHDAAAVRFFTDVASDPQTTVNKHMADHELRCIGLFDDEAGGITGVESRVVLTGAALLASQQAAQANAEESR